jgi:hypothetical protein
MKKLFLPVVTMLLSVVSTTVFAGGPSATIQVVHNSPDLAGFGTIDLYYYFPGGSSGLLANDFDYREATSFVNVSNSVNLNGFSLGIAPSASTSIGDTIIDVGAIGNLTDVTNYIMMVYGQGNILLISPALTTSPSPPAAAVAFFHGGDDAPAVDVNVRGQGTLFDNVEFGGLDGYFALNPLSYVIDVFDSTSTTKVKSYYAPLGTASGAAALVFASGYLNPGSGQPAFGVFAALASGTVIPLPEVKAGFAQIIHNSADAAAGTVDVYTRNNLAGTAYETVLAADDLAFRAGTAVLPIEFYEGGNDSVTVAIAPSSSSSINDAIWTKKYKLMGNSQYLLFANGILPSSSGYSPATAFDVIAGAAAFQSAGGTGFTDVNIFHGVTDAPTIDVVETAPGSAQFADDLSYGEFSGYNAVNAANNYTVEVRDASGTVNPLGGNFFLPLGLNPQANGAAIVVFASGFLDPSNNNAGASFQLCAKGGTAGAATCFSPIPLSVEEKAFVSNMIMYPNPASSNFNIEYMLESAQSVKVNVYNAAGQLQITADNGVESKGRGMTTLNVSNLASGMYFVNVLVGENVNVTRSIIVE